MSPQEGTALRQVIKKTLFTAMAATSVLSMSGACAHAADANSETGDSPGVLSGNSIQAPLDVPVNACGNTVDPVAALNPSFGNACSHGERDDERAHERYERYEGRDSYDDNSYDDDSYRGGHGGGHGGGYGHERRHEHGGYGDERGYGDDREGSYGREYGYGDEYGGDDYRRDDYRHEEHRHGSPSGTHAVAHDSPGVLSGNAVSAPVKAPVNLCGNTVDVIALLNPAFGTECASKEGGPRHARPPHATPRAHTPVHPAPAPRPVTPAPEAKPPVTHAPVVHAPKPHHPKPHHPKPHHPVTHPPVAHPR